MKFYKLTRQQPTTGLITIRPNDEIKLINVSPTIPLMIEFSTTDGQKEQLPLMDEIQIQNSASYLKRAYFRMEIMVEQPLKMQELEEAFCKMDFIE